MSSSISGLVSAASLTSDIAGSNAGKQRTPRMGESAPQPSAVVTLSDEARILSRFAEKGMSLAMRTLGGSASSEASNERAIYTDQELSRDEFQTLLENFGATADESAKLMATVDQDRNGAISRNEFLKLVAGSSQVGSDTDPAGPLLAMIDRKGDSNGSAGLEEFVRFTTAFADAQQRKLADS